LKAGGEDGLEDGADVLRFREGRYDVVLLDDVSRYHATVLGR
jgi:hypothetical protein